MTSFLGGNQPSTIVLRPQQSCEDCPRVDTRSAPPVDRAVPVDQPNRSGVANDGVILDPCGCESTTPLQRLTGKRLRQFPSFTHWRCLIVVEPVVDPFSPGLLRRAG